MRVNVESLVEVSVDGRAARSHASPTPGLKLDLVRSIGGNADLPVPLSRIVLVDDTGTERDQAGIDSTRWSFTYDTLEYVWHQAQQTVAVPITVGYSIARLRLYGGTRLYFEHTLPTPIPVSPGQAAVVAMTLKVTVSWSHEGSGVGVTKSYTIRTAGTVVKRFTSGEERGVKPYYIWITKQDMTKVRIGTMTVTVDEVNLRVVGSLTYVPDVDIVIIGYDYDIETGTYLYISMQPITLTAGLGHSWTLRIQL